MVHTSCIVNTCIPGKTFAIHNSLSVILSDYNSLVDSGAVMKIWLPSIASIAPNFIIF